MIRAALDVNVVVSAVITPSGTPGQLLLAWRAKRFSLVISDGMIGEIETKLRSARIAGPYHVGAEGVLSVLALLRTESDVAPMKTEAPTPVTGDSEDDYVLATGVAGGADYLVTGDKRLLELVEHGEMKIVSPREFLQILEQERS